jgi:hypothetical protein
MTAKLIWTKHQCLVLCHLGHVLESHSTGPEWGGSQFASDISWFQHNPSDSTNRFNRLDAECKGLGHTVGCN